MPGDLRAFRIGFVQRLAAPQQQLPSARLRVFIDYLVEHLFRAR